MKRFDSADSSYLEQALGILEKSLQINMASRLKQSPVLCQDEVSRRFDAYISSLDFNNFVTYEFA